MMTIDSAETFKAPDLKEKPISRAHIEWITDNIVFVTDPHTGNRFKVTTQPKKNMFVAGRPVKARLYVNGKNINQWEKNLSRPKAIQAAKDHFGPVLNLILNREVKLKFSSKAGCSCGCSPGFIIQNDDIPFNIWMKTL